MPTIDTLEHQAIQRLQQARDALDRICAIPPADPRLVRQGHTLMQQITALISEVEDLCHAVRSDQLNENRMP